MRTGRRCPTAGSGRSRGSAMRPPLLRPPRPPSGPRDWEILSAEIMRLCPLRRSGSTERTVRHWRPAWSAWAPLRPAPANRKGRAIRLQQNQASRNLRKMKMRKRPKRRPTQTRHRVGKLKPLRPRSRPRPVPTPKAQPQTKRLHRHLRLPKRPRRHRHPPKRWEIAPSQRSKAKSLTRAIDFRNHICAAHSEWSSQKPSKPQPLKSTI
jgi:hypothetical protein